MAQPPKKMKKDKKDKTEKGISEDKQENEEFPTDWDVDYYKTDYESEEHWELRKSFMLAHKDKFPEDTLVCYAQVFVNMEFMGCKYPSETMLRVAELSKDIAKEFRKQRAGRLQRTFVTASDAAEQRVKGRATAQRKQESKNSDERASTSSKRKSFGTGEWNSQSNKNTNIDLFADLPYGKFILSFIGGRCWIRNSAQRCKVEYREEEEEGTGSRKKLKIYLDNVFVASACEENNKATKEVAVQKALDVLQRTCYTIKQNPMRDTIKIDKSNNQVVLGVIKQAIDSSDADKKIDANNKGFKMMKMMGWSGGGLGSKTQGREDPVSYLLKNNRCGLGNTSSQLDRKYFEKLLNNYVNSPDIRELQFEPTFSKDERATLHQIACKFNLKSNSRGDGDNRRLMINKKNITDAQILHEVLVEKNPNYCDRYLVQVPGEKAKLFPQHTEKLQPDP